MIGTWFRRLEEVEVDFAQQQRNPGKHMVGLSVVIGFHVLLGWALVSGLARKVVEVINPPIETKIIEEIKPPPPPPETLPPPPKFAPPPPSFVPPPEVVVNPPPVIAPTITTTRVVPPPAPPVTISPPPAPAAPPAPPAPPARVASRLDFNVCAKPSYNAATQRAAVEGTVIISYTMDTNGKISDAAVVKSAGVSREHRMLDRFTLDAVLACVGRPGTIGGVPQKLTDRVEYVWKLVD